MEFVLYLFILLIIIIVLWQGGGDPIKLFDGIGRIEEPEYMTEKPAGVKFDEIRQERYIVDDVIVDTTGRTSQPVKMPKSILKRT